MNICVDTDACSDVGNLIPCHGSYQNAAEVGCQPFVQNTSFTLHPLHAVRHGFDIADNEIVKHMQAGSLVITSDNH